MPHRTRIAPEMKAQTVLRVLAGESLETLGTELGVSVARITRWEQIFTAAGEAALKKDAETRGRSFLQRHRKQLAQWLLLLLVLLAVTLFLVRFMTFG